MFRPVRVGLALALVTLAAACADGPTGSGTRPALRSGRAAALTAGQCTTVSSLLTQAAVIFGDGSPNYNSVRGKIENLAKHVGDGNLADAKTRAFDIVDFVLTKEAEADLVGTEEQVAAFASEIYCYAGLDIVVSDPSNSHLIYPDDQEQVVVSEDGQAGILFPAFPVNAPTLVTFVPEAAAPLNTKLDQYPGFFSITAQADADTILTQPVTVGVCAQGVIPADVRARLRLGHGLKTAEEAVSYEGFEITPAAQAAFLQCENATEVAQSTVGGRLWSRLAAAVLPKRAFAFQAMEFGGGVGGTVTEFSPFAPVDPALEFGGGVGGTVTEFMRGAALSMEFGFASALSGCDSIQAPIGSPVRSDCLPFVRVRTRMGTVFFDVPVQWDVTAGGGSIATRTAGACSAFASSASDVTDSRGESDVCWTLGAEGLNQVVATPAVGGDAVPGVHFLPAARTFDATANPPSALAFTQSPTSSAAGAPLTAVVEVRDRNGERVLGYSGTVTVGIASGPAGAVLGGTTTRDAVEGVATFGDLVLTRAGTYTLDVRAPFLPGPADLPVSAAFVITPGPAALMSILQGNSVTVASGSATTPPPVVQVTDTFGNPIGGLDVEWTPALSSTATVSPGVSTTDAIGRAGTTWTLGDGANQLRAELVSDPSVFAVFDATGTTTLSDLNVCAPGGAKDPVNDPAKPYAFYLPDPGQGRTIRTISLYFASQGRANAPTEYEVELTTQRATFDPAVSVPVATRARVNLRGNNSEDKLATFTLSQPIVGASGTSRRDVMVRLRVVANPDGAVLTFNAGPCSPGSKNCKVPPSCQATEVSSPLPYPVGTFYRRSVGITVRGN